MYISDGECIRAQDAREKLGKHAEWVGKEAEKVN